MNLQRIKSATKISASTLAVFSRTALAVALAATWPSQLLAQASPELIEEVITVGTRIQEGRSVADSLVPVDVVSGADFSNQGATDLDTLLANLVPSYNVNQQAISDTATFVRPAQLRGLPPDTTLVLVNGKRRHRAAVITLLGGGVADGAQGPDISTIPTIALKQVEVLRDGAAAQYGSDAIAGVINFELKDYAEGGSIEARVGQYFEGDGDSYDLAANWGLPLGNNGFVNFSFEYKESDTTNRSQQRPDAQGLVDAGSPHRYAAGQYITNPNYADVFHPNVMIWGAPEFDHDYKFFANFGTSLTDNVEVYGHSNYAKRRVEGGFFFRHPHARGSITTGPMVETEDPDNPGMMITVPTILVADLDGMDKGGTCGIIRVFNNIPHLGDINDVLDDDNCESFVTRFPGGFVPRFGGEMDDRSLAVGVRGDLGNWHGDLSAVWGQHEAAFFMRHTINPQLLAKPGITVANIPTDYNPGAYTETDYTINLDLS
ncbi:MAG: TonB-dependent receptor plug domain-containing protein, partial [Pseudomonadales bacterium]